jgi:hypothetical protein
VRRANAASINASLAPGQGARVMTEPGLGTGKRPKRSSIDPRAVWLKDKEIFRKAQSRILVRAQARAGLARALAGALDGLCGRLSSRTPFPKTTVSRISLSRIPLSPITLSPITLSPITFSRIPFSDPFFRFAPAAR